MRCFSVPVALALVVMACASPRPRFDLIVHGGQVYDGSSEQPQRVDIGIVGDRIEAVGDLKAATAVSEINASGQLVTPGFVDTQNQSGTTLLLDGDSEHQIRQGITSVIVGDVDSPAFWTADSADVDALRRYSVSFDWTGLDGYFERLLRRGVTVNIGTLIPLSRTDRAEATIADAMQQGALGVSVTRNGSSEDVSVTELIPLARVAASFGGVLALQAGGTGDVVLRALDDALQVARATRVPLVLYQPQIAVLDPSAARWRERVRLMRDEGLAIHTTAAPARDDTEGASAWLRQPGASIGSAGSNEQSRERGAFRRVVGRYVAKDNVLSWGEAVRRMTSIAASQFALDGRGVIRVGHIADVVVFDATAVHYVVINGVPVLDRNGLTGARPGRALFGRGRRLVGPAS